MRTKFNLLVLFINILLLAICLPLALADTPIKLNKIWTVTELSNPESVVYDEQRHLLYVSNVNGDAMDKDSNGFISIVRPDGVLLKKHWVTGLDAPKGLALRQGILYVADIDSLIAIATDTGEIIASYQDKQAKFLNDVTIDDDGVVYVSDMFTNRIYSLRDGNFSIWLEDPKLAAPNGLHAQGAYIILGSWGNMTNGFQTDIPGRLQKITIADKNIQALSPPVGNLDGVESDDQGNYYVTDWMAGKLYLLTAAGDATLLLTLNPGMADHEFISAQKLLILPMMQDNTLLGYTVDF